MTFTQFIFRELKNIPKVSSILTRVAPYLTTDISLDVVVNKEFPLPFLGWNLFNVMSGKRYLSRVCNGNALCIFSIGNVFVARYEIPLVIIQFLLSCHDSLHSSNSVKIIFGSLFSKLYTCHIISKYSKLF